MIRLINPNELSDRTDPCEWNLPLLYAWPSFLHGHRILWYYSQIPGEIKRLSLATVHDP